jgi:hypothetical protein
LPERRWDVRRARRALDGDGTSGIGLVGDWSMTNSCPLLHLHLNLLLLQLQLQLRPMQELPLLVR